jgi:hypothetical protein
VVEVHLLAEISAKRENFFEAAGALAECRASLRDTCDGITALRQHVSAVGAPLMADQLSKAQTAEKTYPSHRCSNRLTAQLNMYPN